MMIIGTIYCELIRYHHSV